MRDEFPDLLRRYERAYPGVHAPREYTTALSKRIAAVRARFQFRDDDVRERIKVRDGVGLLLNRGVMRNCVLVPLDPATGKVIGFD